MEGSVSWQFVQWSSALINWDVGLGMRFQVKGLIAQIDFIRFPELTAAQMMMGRPFRVGGKSPHQRGHL